MVKILITRQLQPIAKQLLSKKYYVDVNPTDAPMTKEELKKAVSTYDGILSTIFDKFDADVLSFATQLKAISNYGAGLDNIDIAEAQNRKIAIFNLPDATTNSTADLTFALFLSLARRIPEAKSYVQQGRWAIWEPGLFLGEELNGKKFGIIGYGKIGRAVAKRAFGFGMNVLVYHHSKIFPAELEVTQLDWEEFLQQSDYISLHVPLTKETYRMINLNAMRKMAKKPIIINMSRGAVIHTDDLVTALDKGLVRGAALDVTDPEPISAEHPLCRMDNCLIIPHLGSATLECRTEMAKRAAENLLGFFHD